MFINSSKVEDGEKYFPGFLYFTDCTEQQILRPVDNKRKKNFYSGKKKRHTVKIQLMVNIHGFIIHKLRYKKEENMIMIFIKRIILSLQTSSKCI
jgi:hypothetical protein